MTPTTDTAETTEAGDENRATRLLDVVKGRVTALGEQVGDRLTRQRNARERSRLLRQLGEAAVAHHAAGAKDFSADMVSLIEAVADLDPATGPERPDDDDA